ncbi:hypothetical protein ACFQH3_16730 [Haladaptatus sp. GCM10025707]|uniref:hypothetical protein n=1 Tax=unclassified Haladaptatus TaxID=2622732 RepID=UPI0023E896EC|nr:hypothetical protein [Haladaptatus sp. QDMS2]
MFASLSFDGPYLVVELAPDHEVTQVNLIDAEGSLYTQSSVATGETRVQLRLLDIKPEGSDYEHYEPGSYTLVADTGSESFSRALELKPELQIEDIAQYTDGSRPSDLGKLAVTVRNTGSGPTWVYEIVYDNAPNFGAHQDIGSSPGVIQLRHPSETSSLIIEPNGTQKFVSSSAALLFSNQENPECGGDYEFTVIVGQAIGEPLKQDIRATVDGEVTSAGLTGEYTCSKVAVEILGGDDSNG